MKKTHSISFFKEVEEEFLKLKDDKEAKSLVDFSKPVPASTGREINF